MPLVGRRNEGYPVRSITHHVLTFYNQHITDALTHVIPTERSDEGSSEAPAAVSQELAFIAVFAALDSSSRWSSE